MRRILHLSKKRVSGVPSTFKRFLDQKIDWNQRLVLILGHRGAGKTTMLLQRMQQRSPDESVYLSLDDIFFEAKRLVYVIDDLVKAGYRNFFIDEVHRNANWSADLKSAYDNHPDIRIAATGSSLLQVHKGQEDLSRRASVYHLPALSLREYIEMERSERFDVLDLKTIVENHHELAADFHDRVDVLRDFTSFLSYGCYPFFKESKTLYPIKLKEIINLVIDSDIQTAEDITYNTSRNVKKLLYVISQSVPFKPNISRLSRDLGIPRNTILRILDLLEQAGVLLLLRAHTGGMSYLNKPEKIYLNNPNLAVLYADGTPEKGNLRETFFFSQMQVGHQVTSAKAGDFLVDGRYTFEIGGSRKNARQILGVPESYIAADNLKGGSGRKIPLWLFGFMY